MIFERFLIAHKHKKSCQNESTVTRKHFSLKFRIFAAGIRANAVRHSFNMIYQNRDDMLRRGGTLIISRGGLGPRGAKTGLRPWCRVDLRELGTPTHSPVSNYSNPLMHLITRFRTQGRHYGTLRKHENFCFKALPHRKCFHNAFPQRVIMTVGLIMHLPLNWNLCFILCAENYSFQHR